MNVKDPPPPSLPPFYYSHVEACEHLQQPPRSVWERRPAAQGDAFDVCTMITSRCQFLDLQVVKHEPRAWCVQVNGREAEEVKDTLAHKYGIMVRHYRKELLDGFVRISVGKPDQTDALLAALRDMAAAGGYSSA